VVFCAASAKLKIGFASRNIVKMNGYVEAGWGKVQNVSYEKGLTKLLK
jgi:hypothetical protein